MLNIVKFSTHSSVMAIFILLTTNEWRGFGKIGIGASIGVLGSIVYDFLLGDALKVDNKSEKEYVKGTKYYKKVRNFNKIVSSTVKVGISLVGGDIAADGDLDQAGLIKFLVTIFALPFYMFLIEPHIICGGGVL